MISLDEKLVNVLRTTQRHLERLKGLRIKTVRDFLQYYPWDYDDRREFTKVAEMRTDQENTVRGKISNLGSERTFKKKLLVRALFSDETGSVEVVWFNQPYLLKILKDGMEVILVGKLKHSYEKNTFSNPIHELVGQDLVHTARIVPKYHETEGIKSRWIREKMKPILPATRQFEDYLPAPIKKAEKLMDLSQANATAMVFTQITFDKNSYVAGNYKPSLLIKTRLNLKKQPGIGWLISRVEPEGLDGQSVSWRQIR